MFELYILPPAESFIASLDEEGRRKVASILERIKGDPYVDGRVKFDLPLPPAIFYLYVDPDFKVAYKQIGNVTIRIYNIGFADQPLLPR